MHSLGFPSKNALRTNALRSAIVSAAVSALMMSVPLSAQKNAPLPSKAEMNTLLEVASRRTNLWAVGSAPFHLRATVKSYGAKGETREGTFELWWASPARYRDEINWGDGTSSRIADKDALWVDGADAHRYDTFRVTQLLGFSSRLNISAGQLADKVQSKQIDGAAAICVRFTRSSSIPNSMVMADGSVFVASRPIPDPSTCLDTINNLPVQIESTYRRLELGDHVQIGDKHFPRRLAEFTRGGAPIVQVELQTLEPLDPNLTAPFAPRAGIAAEPWCPNMILPRALQLRLPAGIFYAQGFFASPYATDNTSQALLVFHVDEGGHPVDVRAFTTVGVVPVKAKAKGTLLQSSFAPASCGGKPIAWEFLAPDYPLQSLQ
jgi:hypothetical protein